MTQRFFFFLGGGGNNDINMKVGHHNCFSRKIAHTKTKQVPGTVSGS